MDNRMLWFAAVMLTAFVALLAYVIWTRTEPEDARRRALPPKRSKTDPIRRFDRTPSGGLAWSKARYSAQYLPRNVKSSKFVGRKLLDREEERCLDVAGRAYSRQVLDGFSYTDPEAPKRPELVVEYLARAETFVGRIRGTGMKPNFAYQVKLRGNYKDNPDGFEKIGYTGRWRLPGRGTNYKDKAYEECPAREEVEAYLLFDFFVTDDKGNVDKEFYADSSLHVLFNSSVQRSPKDADGGQVPVIRRESDRALYANPKVDLRMHRLYAESEQNMQGRKDHRQPIGQAFLPPGKYQAEVVLTEESFHGYGDAGFWATVMTAPVEFEVEDKERPQPTEITGNLMGAPLSFAQAELVEIDATTHTAELVEGGATSDDPQIVFGKRDFVSGKRHVFCVEVNAAGVHTWQLFVDLGDGFELRPAYSFTTRGRSGWQRFEIEITSMVAGRSARLRLDPARREGFIGARNAALCVIQEEPLPGPVAADGENSSSVSRKANAIMVIMETTKGTIKLELFEDKAPKSTENFLRYVDEEFYDGTVFHRVIPNFMAQGGGFDADYKRKETHAEIKNEARAEVKNLRGTLAMARTGVVDSATSQFFINVKDNDFLDHTSKTPQGFGYAVFGKVVEGMDVVDAIVSVKTGAGGDFGQDVPQEQIIITSIRRVEDQPAQ